MTGSRCSASPARAVRPLARRIDSAIRRAARAASTDPPHTTGLVSASAMASILAGLTARSRCGEQAIATSSSAVATRSASVRGPSVTRSRYSSITTAVASWSRLEVGRIVAPAAGGVVGDGRVGGQATTTWQPRRTASATAAAVPVSDAVGREHHDQVEAPGPARQAGAGPGDERHRAPGLEHGAQQARVRAGGDHRPRTGLLLEHPGDGLVGGLGGVGHLAAYPCARLGERPEPAVGTLEGGLVVQPGLVEPGHHRIRPACVPRR